jgi:hypothetical protein
VRLVSLDWASLMRVGCIDAPLDVWQVLLCFSVRRSVIGDRSQVYSHSRSLQLISDLLMAALRICWEVVSALFHFLFS